MSIREQTSCFMASCRLLCDLATELSHPTKMVVADTDDMADMLFLGQFQVLSIIIVVLDLSLTYI